MTSLLSDLDEDKNRYLEGIFDLYNDDEDQIVLLDGADIWPHIWVSTTRSNKSIYCKDRKRGALLRKCLAAYFVYGSDGATIDALNRYSGVPATTLNKYCTELSTVLPRPANKFAPRVAKRRSSKAVATYAPPPPPPVTAALKEEVDYDVYMPSALRPMSVDSLDGSQDYYNPPSHARSDDTAVFHDCDMTATGNEIPSYVLKSLDKGTTRISIAMYPMRNGVSSLELNEAAERVFLQERLEARGTLMGIVDENILLDAVREVLVEKHSVEYSACVHGLSGRRLEVLCLALVNLLGQGYLAIEGQGAAAVKEEHMDTTRETTCLAIEAKKSTEEPSESNQCPMLAYSHPLPQRLSRPPILQLSISTSWDSYGEGELKQKLDKISLQSTVLRIVAKLRITGVRLVRACLEVIVGRQSIELASRHRRVPLRDLRSSLTKIVEHMRPMARAASHPCSAAKKSIVESIRWLDLLDLVE